MARILKLNNMTAADWEAVAGSLAQGGLACLPSDTVYGLACLSTRPLALDKIYAVKGRDANKPVALVFQDIEQVFSLITSLTEPVRQALTCLVPGPVTAILPVFGGELTSLGLLRGASIGVRLIPPPLSDIYRRLPGPLAVTSANLSGEPDPCSVKEIPEGIRKACDVIVDAGPTEHCRPSTVVDLTPLAGDGLPRILREGVLSRPRVEKLIGGLEKPEEEVERELPPWLRKQK